VHGAERHAEGGVTHEFLHGLRCRTAHETDWQGRMWAYDLEVPVLSVFFGITIRIYFEGHAPPHLHVAYAEYAAVLEIDSGKHHAA